MDINYFNTGEQVFDISDKRLVLITNKTSNSIEIYFTKTSSKGINCKQWFSISSKFDSDIFFKRFIKNV